jgi:hypothetical protein
MFYFVPYISDPVWNFTYVAYSLTSSKPAKTPRDGASDTPYLIIAFSHNYIVNNMFVLILTNKLPVHIMTTSVLPKILGKNGGFSINCPKKYNLWFLTINVLFTVINKLHTHGRVCIFYCYVCITFYLLWGLFDKIDSRQVVFEPRSLNNNVI